MLTAVDKRLLAKLQINGRLSNQDVAAETGLSASACWRRVRLLERVGIIQGYAALVDREKAGFAVSAIVQVALERHDADVVDRFVRKVASRAEILECFATTGDADYHLRVVVADIAAYNVFLSDFLFKLPGIRQVRSNVILKEIKSGVTLPF